MNIKNISRNFDKAKLNNLSIPEEVIVQSARMSTTGDLKGFTKDKKLLQYLWDNKHATPFEMYDITYEVECPIFVARQWMRHRTQSYNEFSGRYSVFEVRFYVPREFKLQDEKNKQASGTKGSDKFQDDAFELYITALDVAKDSYDKLIEMGVSREQARMVLPVSTYTKFRAKANLRNWLHFCDLRSSEHAQEEIRILSNFIMDDIKRYYLPNLEF